MADDTDDMENMTPQQLAELQKKNCIFCKIAEKHIPAKIAHEDDDIICILDINPAAEGHILVYPKKHYMIVPHLPGDLLAKLLHRVKYISNLLLKTLQCAGTTVFVANGSAAGQKSPHVLIHVFPRRDNDGLVKLPKYEMNNDQILKLKKELKPYISHVFGDDHDSADDSDDDDGADEEEVKERAKPAQRKAESKKPEDKPSGKSNISLDDIQKLFG